MESIGAALCVVWFFLCVTLCFEKLPQFLEIAPPPQGWSHVKLPHTLGSPSGAELKTSLTLVPVFYLLPPLLWILHHTTLQKHKCNAWGRKRNPWFMWHTRRPWHAWCFGGSAQNVLSGWGNQGAVPGGALINTYHAAHSENGAVLQTHPSIQKSTFE